MCDAITRLRRSTLLARGAAHSFYASYFERFVQTAKSKSFLPPPPKVQIALIVTMVYPSSGSTRNVEDSLREPRAENPFQKHLKHLAGPSAIDLADFGVPTPIKAQSSLTLFDFEEDDQTWKETDDASNFYVWQILGRPCKFQPTLTHTPRPSYFVRRRIAQVKAFFDGVCQHVQVFILLFKLGGKEGKVHADGK